MKGEARGELEREIESRGWIFFVMGFERRARRDVLDSMLSLNHEKAREVRKPRAEFAEMKIRRGSLVALVLHLLSFSTKERASFNDQTAVLPSFVRSFVRFHRPSSATVDELWTSFRNNFHRWMSSILEPRQTLVSGVNCYPPVQWLDVLSLWLFSFLFSFFYF